MTHRIGEFWHQCYLVVSRIVSDVRQNGCKIQPTSVVNNRKVVLKRELVLQQHRLAKFSDFFALVKCLLFELLPILF